MIPHISYRDIPKEERKRLATKAFDLTPRLRNLQFVSVVVPMVVSGVITDSIVPKHDAFMSRLGVCVLIALVLCAIVQQFFVQPRLKAAIEKLKNA
jgi:hypothetical protein